MDGEDEEEESYSGAPDKCDSPLDVNCAQIKILSNDAANQDAKNFTFLSPINNGTK